jgi:hypothetical protein
MATVMSMKWHNITKQDYERVRKEANWEGDHPRGGKYHVAWFTPDGLCVLDVWDSHQDFEHFAQTRLMPAVQRLGIEGQPQVEFHEAHATFAPNP